MSTVLVESTTYTRITMPLPDLHKKVSDGIATAAEVQEYEDRKNALRIKMSPYREKR